MLLELDPLMTVLIVHFVHYLFQALAFLVLHDIKHDYPLVSLDKKHQLKRKIVKVLDELVQNEKGIWPHHVGKVVTAHNSRSGHNSVPDQSDHQG